MYWCIKISPYIFKWKGQVELTIYQSTHSIKHVYIHMYVHVFVHIGKYVWRKQNKLLTVATSMEWLESSHKAFHSFSKYVSVFHTEQAQSLLLKIK